MSNADRGSLAELAYTMSVEALRQQERALAELRSRTGTLLTAGSIVTSFLGTAALERDGFDGWTISGLGAFGLVLAVSLVVLTPFSGWNFTMLGSGFLARYGAGPLAETHEKLSADIDAKWTANDCRFKCLMWLLRVGIVALALEAACWSIRLGL